MNSPFICLDIGNSLIHLMVGRLDERGEAEICRVDLIPSFGITDGLVVDPVQLSATIRLAVDHAENDLGELINTFYLGVDASLTKLQPLAKVQHFNEDDHVISSGEVIRLLAELRRSELSHDESIDFIPVIYSLDQGRLTSEPQRQTSRELGVRGYLLQRRNETLLQLLRTFYYSRIRISGLLHTGMAVGAVLLSEAERLSGTIILDLGAAGSKFYFYRSGFMQGEAFVPLGGDSFTKDLEFILHCSHNVAEELKFYYGFTERTLRDDEDDKELALAASGGLTESGEQPLARLVPRILQARLAQIVELGQETLSAAKVPWQSCPLYLIGGETQVLGLSDAVASLWPLSVNVLAPPQTAGSWPTFTTTYAMVHYVAKLKVT